METELSGGPTAEDLIRQYNERIDLTPLMTEEELEACANG